MSTQAQVVSISAQIPKRLGEQLGALAAAEKRSKSYYIKESLERFLHEKTEDVQDYLEGERLYREFVASGEQGTTLDALAKEHDL